MLTIMMYIYINDDIQYFVYKKIYGGINYWGNLWYDSAMTSDLTSCTNQITNQLWYN